jgi:hypothetical protein
MSINNKFNTQHCRTKNIVPLYWVSLCWCRVFYSHSECPECHCAECRGAVETALTYRDVSTLNWYAINEYLHTHTCMYICVCICMYICTYGMFVCMWVCMYVCMYVCISVCMYMSLYVCLSACIYVCTHICLCMYMYVCIYVMYVCMCVCIYVCMHIRIYRTFRVSTLVIHMCVCVCVCDWVRVCVCVLYMYMLKFLTYWEQSRMPEHAEFSVKARIRISEHVG